MIADYSRMTRSQLLEELHKAQAKLKPKDGDASSDDVRALIHNLEVHQEEVKLQNVQLIEAQRALEQSRDRYADLFDYAPCGYITLDMQGAIQEINLTGTALLEGERVHLLGKPLRLSILDEDRPLFANQILRCRTENGTVTADLRIRGRRSGEITPVHLSMRQVSETIEPQFRVIITDLRERASAEKVRQELLVREETARAASQAKDRFLAMLSHELRTPLTPVLMAVSALENGQVTPGDLGYYVGTIRKNVELEARLIDDLLDMTRITRGKLRLEFEAVDLHAVVHDVQAICGSELEAKKLRFVLDLEAAARYVHADPTRLRQILWNLVKNAIRFTPAGGTITIATRNDEPGKINASITDTGEGIDADLLARMFGPFEQGIGNSATGLGLGLFICKALIDAHDGQITAQSDGKGKGATFRFVLNTVAAPVQSLVPLSAPKQPASGRMTGARILVVEDHPDTARLIAKLLEREGHQIKLAHSVGQAMAMKARDFDLVISDVGLPDGTGMELMRKLNGIHPIKGIALSGYGTEEDVQRSYDAGFAEHLTKPINFNHLCSIIQQLMAQDSGQNPSATTASC